RCRPRSTRRIAFIGLDCTPCASGRRCDTITLVRLRGALSDMLQSRPIPMKQSATHARRAASPNANGAVTSMDSARIEAAVREILLAVGEDPDREGLRETPARIARMYAELFSGLHADPREMLKKTFTQKYDEIVLVRDIGFESMCEHHLL